MNPTHDEQDLIRWLDGEMDEAERSRFERRLAADPVFHVEAMEMRKLTETVRQNLPPPGDIPHADFFNSQIQREIQEMKLEAGKGSAQSAGSGFRWLRLPWLLAGAAALIAALAVTKPSLGGSDRTEVVSSYTPNPDVQVRVIDSAEARATVLMLDGLPEMPASTPMVGYKVHRSETEPQLSMTTLFSESGEVLMVMAKDSRNQPMVYAR